jgi:Phage integrase family
VVVASALFATLAHAGTYNVFTCSIDGAFYPNRAWTSASNPAGNAAFQTDTSCPKAGDALSASLAPNTVYGTGTFAALDFAGRRIYVPLLRRDSAGLLVRVSGIKTEAAERIVPMVPTLYDVLLDHKAAFGYGPHDPAFATRNGTRNTVDNVRWTIVDPAVERANQLLVARGEREIVRCTPHTLRRTFASILAEVNPPPRRAMYLIGHTNPTLIMRVYQQVMDMGDTGVQTLEKVIGCTLTDAFTLLSGRGVLATNRQPAEKNASRPDSWNELKGAETAW